MNEQDYLGYLMGALDDEAHAAVEAHLAAHPEERAKVDRLHHALEPLAADRGDAEPPPGLVLNTLARVAEHIVATEERVPETEPSAVKRYIETLTRPAPPPQLNPVYPWNTNDPLPPEPRRRNLLAVMGLTAAMVVIGGAAVMNFRQTAEITACQNNMRDVHQGLNTYCDFQADGHFPKVATDGSVRSTLAQMQQMVKLGDDKLTCPSRRHDKSKLPTIDYDYSLGYRDHQGNLDGHTRDCEDRDVMPIFADSPRRENGKSHPVNHRKGQNVLFAGGNVRFSTTPEIGPRSDGHLDDIYFNEDREVRAGKHRRDAVLGSPDDHP